MVGGSVVVAFFAFSDVVDGIMARLEGGRSGGWGGNFLDSTLDRLADGAIFAGLTIWFFTGGEDPAIGTAAVVCLVLGMVVSYARAKAESLGYQASVGGIAERAERLASVLLITGGLTGLGGLPPVVLFGTLILLALASLVTIVQRMSQCGGRPWLKPMEPLQRKGPAGNACQRNWQATNVAPPKLCTCLLEPALLPAQAVMNVLPPCKVRLLLLVLGHLDLKPGVR